MCVCVCYHIYTKVLSVWVPFHRANGQGAQAGDERQGLLGVVYPLLMMMDGSLVCLSVCVAGWLVHVVWSHGCACKLVR